MDTKMATTKRAELCIVFNEVVKDWQDIVEAVKIIKNYLDQEPRVIVQVLVVKEEKRNR